MTDPIETEARAALAVDRLNGLLRSGPRSDKRYFGGNDLTEDIALEILSETPRGSISTNGFIHAIERRGFRVLDGAAIITAAVELGINYKHTPGFKPTLSL